MTDSSEERYVIEARLLGMDDESNKKRRKNVSGAVLDIAASA